MEKKNVLIIFLIFILYSCTTDDTSPMDIMTSADTVILAQNSDVEIFIFQNDNYIPSIGELTITNPIKGVVSIHNNNTPNNLSDDTVIYVANPNITGEDTFQYTICDNSGNCKTEHVTITITSLSNVAFTLENVPYQTLSEYNFFEGEMKNLNPNSGVLPYTLNSTLFTDYAKKKRFIWLQNNTIATYFNDNVSLDFPVGAVLIKNFYYENVLPINETKIIETRLMIRKNEGWVFANYIWNDAQNEAYFDLNGSFVDVQWLENGEENSVQYRIPSGAECVTCHKIMEIPVPIGTKPRNLNLVYDYSEGPKNQLNKLVNLGYLENSLPNTISRLPDYNNTSESLDLRARAYLDINCAHCHSEETHCAYRPIRFGYNDTESFNNIGVCVSADTDLGEGLGFIVEPGDARNSVLHFRINSLEPSTRMPLIGRSLRHNEGVNLIEEWINSLNIDCN